MKFSTFCPYSYIVSTPLYSPHSHFIVCGISDVAGGVTKSNVIIASISRPVMLQIKSYDAPTTGVSGSTSERPVQVPSPVVITSYVTSKVYS